MSSPIALIVGAGIGGLAAAVALRRAGWQVRIFERAASPRELGFALNLAPNAMAALRELGLDQPLIGEGHIVREAEIRTLAGRTLRRIHVSPASNEAADARSVIALRPVLHGALLNAIEPSALGLGSEVIGFEANQRGVAIRIKGGRAAYGDILIGADGVASAVRRQLHPHEPPPRSSGYYAVRGVAHQAARHLGALSAALYLGKGMEAAAARASLSAVYWYMSLLSRDLPGEIFDPVARANRLAARLDACYQAIVQNTKAEDIRFDELLDRDPIENWGAGPVTLLGDAAHPMLPHAGQGAAQALEDAVALGLTLKHRREDFAAALRRYERVRSARTGRIVKLARRLARMTTTKSALKTALRTAAVRFLPEQALLMAFFLARHDDPQRDLR
ncbi:MAG TPA: FAD-dependent monooxygenase [Methylomirabilota bacterium]|nr:FAD-dependent monooxygenase [Methylomirabilota bacterium]